MSDNNELSEREREILCLVATGASNKEIGQQLYISANTVKVHLRNIFSKIGVASRTEAAMYAVQNGLLVAVPSDILAVDQVAAGTPHTMGDVPVTAPVEAEPVRHRVLFGRRRWILVFLLATLFLTVGLVTWNNWPFKPFQSSLTLPEGLADWQVKTPTLAARRGLAAVAYENQLYAIGGENDQGVLAGVTRYDLGSDTWQSQKDKPTPVSDIQAGIIGGKIYVPGGKLLDGEISDALEIYLPREDRWEKGPNLPAPRSAYALATFEGKLYLFGGWDGKSYRKEVYAYDPGRDQWETRSEMPTARAYAGAAASGGKMYVLGGINASGLLRINEIYRPELDGGPEKPWSKGVNLPEARHRLGVASVSDYIYVVGGIGNSADGVNSLQLLKEQQIWQPFKAPYPGGLSDFGMAASSSFLYVIGGSLDDRTLDGFSAYQVVYTVSIPLLPGNQGVNP